MNAIKVGDAPVLTLHQLVPELERVHKERHRTLRTCLFGRLAEAPGPDAELTAKALDEPTRFAVRQVASELELRVCLVEEPQEETVYLVPFARHLPRDLAARFARGDVVLPRIEHLLPRRFGARRASPRLLGSALMRVARLEPTRDYVIGSPETETIDLDEAWLLHLQSHLGLRTAQLTLAGLFEAVLSESVARGPDYALLLASVEKARDELTGVLERRLGRGAPVVLDAWLSGEARRAGAAALVGEGARALLQDAGNPQRATLLLLLDNTIKSLPGHPLRAVIDEHKREGLANVLLALSDQVALVWPSLKEAQPARAGELLGLTEELLTTDEAREAALDSHRLPFTFDVRLSRLSAALKQGATSLESLRQLAQAVLRHERKETVAGLESIVEMARRLAALATCPLPPPATSPADEVSQLAAWQAAQGGYLDWARQELRGHEPGALAEGVRAVLTSADALRDQLNERFARAYVRLVEHKGARKNLKDVVPIESALAHFGFDAAAAADGPRLLVVCMDGMSWANLAELRTPLNSRLRAFEPLTTPTQAEGARPPPVLAQVPTITRLSRSSLFLGRELDAGDSLDSSRDPDRFTRHPSAAPLRRPPVLWLKGDLPVTAGRLNDDVRRLISDEQAQVVGVVVNAIDDQLKGSSQLRVALSVDAIPVLDGLLEAAERAGRLVLLCSDHGNVSSARFGPPAVSRAQPAEMGARWRWLRNGEEPLASEVVVASGPLPRPAGATRLAVPFDEATRYTAALRAGEHGGLTLSEAVAPMVLFAPPGLVGDVVDERRLFQRATLPEPGWWTGEVALAASTFVAAPRSAKTPRAPVSEDQRSTGIVESELFRLRARNRRKEDIERVRQGLAALLRSGGRLGRDAFAREVGVQIPSRVAGYVATMQEFLNVDQEQVVGMDARQTLVELDVVLLEKLFLRGAP